MGSDQPLRIDFFDDDLESIRYFNTDSQLSGESVARSAFFPLAKFHWTKLTFGTFVISIANDSKVNRQNHAFIVKCRMASHTAASSITCRSFLKPPPAFRLPAGQCCSFRTAEMRSLLEQAWREIGERHDLCSLDPERPILAPHESFYAPADLQMSLSKFRRISYASKSLARSKYRQHSDTLAARNQD